MKPQIHNFLAHKIHKHKLKKILCILRIWLKIALGGQKNVLASQQKFIR